MVVNNKTTKITCEIGSESESDISFPFILHVSSDDDDLVGEAIARTEMSEDEFVVLLEHAGLTEVSDDGGQEFLEKHMLLEWLVREGIELFGAKFLLQHATSEDGSGGGGQGEEIENGDGDRDDDDDDTAAAGAASELALGGSGTFMGDPRSKLALRILDRLVEREWLSPIEFDYDEDETEVRWISGRVGHVGTPERICRRVRLL